IIDGRNRYRALVWLVSTGEALGPGWTALKLEGLALPVSLLQPDGDNLDWQCLFKRFDAEADDPLAYVLSKNLKRRHLDESQRAMVAGRLANMQSGERTDLEPSANLPKVSTAAASLNVSERSATAGRKVVHSAAPEIAQAVDQGRLAVSAAAEIAAQPAE